MCDKDISLEQLDTLKQIERLLLSTASLPPEDQTIQLSATRPWEVDYRERKHIFLWVPSSTVISMEDYGSLTISATTWLNLGLPSGVRIFAPSASNTVPIMIRCTNEIVP